jgi:hypothetical protein
MNFMVKALKTTALNVLFAAAVVFSAQECVNDRASSCKSIGDACMNPSELQNLVSASFHDESLLPLLRGTVDNIISQDDATALINSLPDFIEASGYDEYSNGRAYTAPKGYAALGLKELQSTPVAYNKLIDIREKVRSSTEKSLGLCPGKLYIDFTTISQKVEGGAHKPHADNCIHYFEDGVAICDTSKMHPYPKRVAASILYLNDHATGNFEGGQFYFANRTNDGEVEEGGTVDISAGKMIYFTSGVENLHGALPVSKSKSKNGQPKRLALAMWYVFDESLMESLQDTDPNAPVEIFSLTLPPDVDMDGLLQSIGTYLVSRQNKPNVGAWTVSKYKDRILHVLFKDHSAMFSVEFVKSSSRIVVQRHTDTTKRASLQYMLQESVMLHGVLDEVSSLVSDSTIDNFNEARDKLPARVA